jgi:hypothetical protein
VLRSRVGEPEWVSYNWVPEYGRWGDCIVDTGQFSHLWDSYIPSGLYFSLITCLLLCCWWGGGGVAGHRCEHWPRVKPGAFSWWKLNFLLHPSLLLPVSNFPHPCVIKRQIDAWTSCFILCWSEIIFFTFSRELIFRIRKHLAGK